VSCGLEALVNAGNYNTLIELVEAASNSTAFARMPTLTAPSSMLFSGLAWLTIQPFKLAWINGNHKYNLSQFASSAAAGICRDRSPHPFSFTPSLPSSQRMVDSA
jgi:hypothetical protein